MSPTRLQDSTPQLWTCQLMALCKHVDRNPVIVIQQYNKKFLCLQWGGGGDKEENLKKASIPIGCCDSYPCLDNISSFYDKSA